MKSSTASNVISRGLQELSTVKLQPQAQTHNLVYALNRRKSLDAWTSWLVFAGETVPLHILLGNSRHLHFERLHPALNAPVHYLLRDT